MVDQLAPRPNTNLECVYYVYEPYIMKAGGFVLSVIADRKIGKSAAPSGAGGEGPQKHFFTAVKRRKQKPKYTGCMFQK